MRLDDATDVFCRSFAFTRSIAHPFEFVRIGGLRVLRDATPKYEPRGQEIVICGLEPGEALRQIADYDPPRHFVCVITDGDLAAGKAAYKAAGYRFLGSEEFFVRDLGLPIDDPPVQVKRVTTVQEADRIARSARTRQIPIPELEGSRIRLYAAWDGGAPIGWVRSIHLTPESTWASNLMVLPGFRRKGIGSALMLKMLQDDTVAGARQNVLLASHVGSKLYPSLGYEKIGCLLAFARPRRPK